MIYAKTDLNQQEVVGTLRKLGYHVWLTHRLGQGSPDMVVTGYHHRLDETMVLLVELKTATGKLTEDEKQWHGLYPDDGPLIVARSAQDIVDWFEQ